MGSSSSSVSIALKIFIFFIFFVWFKHWRGVSQSTDDDYLMCTILDRMLLRLEQYGSLSLWSIESNIRTRSTWVLPLPISSLCWLLRVASTTTFSLYSWPNNLPTIMPYLDESIDRHFSSPTPNHHHHLNRTVTLMTPTINHLCPSKKKNRHISDSTDHLCTSRFNNSSCYVFR